MCYFLNIFSLFEILSMVEEAAGVRLYETKKQGAIRTIEKKEGKVAEIRRVGFTSIFVAIKAFC